MKKKLLIGLIFLITYYGCNSIDKKDSANTSGKENKPESVSKEDVKLTSSPDTLSVALTLRQNDEKEISIQESRTFVEGNGVRLNISVVEEGYLTILYRGSSGDTKVIFPSKEFYDGNNEIEPNQNVTIPQRGWFFFDNKKGTETVYIIYSKKENFDKIMATPQQSAKIFDEISYAKETNNFVTDDDKIVRIVKLKHQ